MTTMCQKSLSLIAAVVIGAGGLLWDGYFRFDRSVSSSRRLRPSEA